MASDPQSLGIAIVGSGQGEAIVTNKVKGIRGGLVSRKLEIRELVLLTIARRIRELVLSLRSNIG